MGVPVPKWDFLSIVVPIRPELISRNCDAKQATREGALSQRKAL